MGTMSDVVVPRPPPFDKKTQGGGGGGGGGGTTTTTTTQEKHRSTVTASSSSSSLASSTSSSSGTTTTTTTTTVTPTTTLIPKESKEPRIQMLGSLEYHAEGSYDGYGPYFRLILPSRQLKELQTIIRDKNTTRSDFKFYADRLIRLVVEEGLNQLPYSTCTITTPTSSQYKGLKFTKGNCGVSIVRSGEAMEQGLRSCCRSIRIGKILVESDLETHEAKVVYAKFPEDICQRKVLLMYPIMSSGNTVIKAVNVLQEHAVDESNVILLNLFSTPVAARSIVTAFPKMTILTSEVNPVAPNHFGQKYFGTD